MNVLLVNIRNICTAAGKMKVLKYKDEPEKHSYYQDIYSDISKLAVPTKGEDSLQHRNNSALLGLILSGSILDEISYHRLRLHHLISNPKGKLINTGHLMTFIGNDKETLDYCTGLMITCEMFTEAIDVCGQFTSDIKLSTYQKILDSLPQISNFSELKRELLLRLADQCETISDGSTSKYDTLFLQTLSNDDANGWETFFMLNFWKKIRYFKRDILQRCQELGHSVKKTSVDDIKQNICPHCQHDIYLWDSLIDKKFKLDTKSALFGDFELKPLHDFLNSVHRTMKVDYIIDYNNIMVGKDGQSEKQLFYMTEEEKQSYPGYQCYQSYQRCDNVTLVFEAKKKDIVITLYKSNNIKRLRSFERAVYPSEDLLMIYTSICLPNHPPVISRDYFDDHIAMVAAQQIPVKYKLGFEKFVKLSTVNPHIEHKRDFFTSSVEVHHIRVCNKMWCIKAEK